MFVPISVIQVMNRAASNMYPPPPRHHTLHRLGLPDIRFCMSNYN